MKAMIFAAGLGSRLKPITDVVPKALIKIGDVTLLEFVIKKLVHFGFNEIIINVHHRADKIIEYLEQENFFETKIVISNEEEKLLNTGGGLKKAMWFFDDGNPFLIYNCDIISNINLKNIFEYHNENNSEVTLAIRKRETNRYFLFDENKLLAGWLNKSNNQKKLIRNTKEQNPLAFSGIHVINPTIFKFFPEEEIFSLTDFYLSICDKVKISGYDHSDDYWIDIGKKDTLELIQSQMKESTLKSILAYIV